MVWVDLEFLNLKSFTKTCTWLEKTITKQAQEKFHCRLSLNRYIYVAFTTESDSKTYDSLKVFVRHLSVRPYMYVCVRKLHFTIKAIVGIPMCLEQSRFKEIPIRFGVVTLYSYNRKKTHTGISLHFFGL